MHFYVQPLNSALSLWRYGILLVVFTPTYTPFARSLTTESPCKSTLCMGFLIDFIDRYFRLIYTFGSCFPAVKGSKWGGNNRFDRGMKVVKTVVRLPPALRKKNTKQLEGILRVPFRNSFTDSCTPSQCRPYYPGWPGSRWQDWEPAERTYPCRWHP